MNLTLALLLVATATGAQPEAMACRAVMVVDGDTLDVTCEGQSAPVRVRLIGIDAPERGRECAAEASEFARVYTEGKPLRLLPRGKDTYGRLLAFVFAGEETESLNYRLLENGLARLYTGRFAFQNQQTFDKYKLAEIHAMTGSTCLWRGKKTARR